MSLSELTTASVWIAGLAIVALIAAGWRKPARATAATVRARRRPRATEVQLAETEVELYRRAGLWRRVWAVIASSGIALVIGAVLATVVSFGIAFTVIRLSEMLRR